MSGTFDEHPAARIAAPLQVSVPANEVVIAGTGAPVQVDQLFVVRLTVFNARTGTEVASTVRAAKSSDDSLFPELVSALTGKAQGTRVVVALPSSAAFGAGGVPPTGLAVDDAVVLVADVLAVPPTSVLPTAAGEPRAPGVGAPAVRYLAGDPTGVTAPDGAVAPDQVTVIELVRGTGAPVRDHSLVTVDYLGQDWGSDQPFVDTYFKEPAVVPVGTDASLPAWDQALVGLPAGSRVIVVDPFPPSQQPGEERPTDHGTIAWVVDVLGVS
ncbi:MAG: hypothetical protein NTV23_01380 [Propionibacteriales bacterium]|nr:hypothetical protein [Propionibacteriales bacterium]